MHKVCAGGLVSDQQSKTAWVSVVTCTEPKIWPGQIRFSCESISQYKIGPRMSDRNTSRIPLGIGVFHPRDLVSLNGQIGSCGKSVADQKGMGTFGIICHKSESAEVSDFTISFL
ncbi:MAG: hypothetical protein EBZ44_07765 [Verrucomicrobia bacterium]|nr:hypothetical protein [Verrucomicrobiota bacterium]NDD57585.1 hypothetical protein [Verrucomicrobiota bacterium]